MVDAPDFADLGAGQRVGAGEAASVEVVKSSSAIVFEAEEERARGADGCNQSDAIAHVKHGVVVSTFENTVLNSAHRSI